MQKNYRKIIKIGECSHGIIIPKGWLRYYELKKGDQLEVITDGKIIIKKPLKKDDENNTPGQNSLIIG